MTKRTINFSYLLLLLAVIVLLIASCSTAKNGCTLSNRAGDTGRVFKMKH